MRLILAALIALAACPTFAQDTAWRCKSTALLWLPDTRIGVATPLGEANADLKIGEALEALDFAFMGSFEADRGSRSLIGDIVCFNRSAAEQTPLGALFGTADPASRITALTGIAAYRVRATDKSAVDFGGGFSGMSVKTDVSLISAGLPPSTSGASDQWVDPIIATRGRHEFT